MKFYVTSIKYTTDDLLDHYDIPEDLYIEKEEYEFTVCHEKRIEHRLAIYINNMDDFIRFVRSICYEVIVYSDDKNNCQVPILAIYDDYME